MNIFDTTTSHSHAYTFHHDCQHLSNPIQTILICDGLGRMLQTKKEAEIENVPKLLNSGRMEYDCFGRTVKQYHPFASNTSNMEYNGYYDVNTLTSTTYDILDRPVKVKLPTSDSTTTTYDFDTNEGKTYFKATTTDPNGIAVTTLTGTRKQQIKTIAPLGAVTTFTYDPLGQLLSSKDPCNHFTYYTYDMLGHMVERNHPDAGTDTYTYDGAGNMTQHSTQILSAANKTIDYHYTYNRLDSIVYPYNPQNNVRYTYGDNTALDNQRGRIALIEDASGFRSYKYGKLGEVTEENRTFVLPNESTPYSFKTQFEYDSWNRVQNITYPDEEVVHYYYNTGGMLRRVRGVKRYLNTVVIDTFIIVPPGPGPGPGPISPKNPSQNEDDNFTADTDTIGGGDRAIYQYYYYNYIDSIRYNEFELKSAQRYGNGTRAEYGYDVLQRLNRLRMYDASNFPLQNITYTYDNVGNINLIIHSQSSGNTLGGSYMYAYQYDSLYRLSESAGMFFGSSPYPNFHTYMSYTADGRITQKRWNGKTLLKGVAQDFDYTLNYTYSTAQPHTVSSILGVPISWDANGNMTTLLNAYFLQWNEENRFWHVDMALGNKCAYYQYDADGERFYKNVGTRTTVTQNGQSVVYRVYDDPVLYASPYVVATPDGYTKHYYVESERFACRIGEGDFPDIGTHAVSSTQLAAKQSEVNDSAPKYIQPKFSYLNTHNAQWSAHHTTYWQHPDHLGSTSWVTDTNGMGYQHLQYMPWGEQFIDRRVSNNGYEARYTFSGKELDQETSFSYFGSRYYSNLFSIWLSVDPMSDKYPSTSPYAYCANNPVRLVDPNGEDIVPTDANSDGIIAAYFNQFSKKAIDKIFGLENIRGYNGSADVRPRYSSSTNFTKDEFCRKLAKSDKNLSSDDIENAYSVYLALQSADDFQVSVWNENSSTVIGHSIGGTLVRDAKPDDPYTAMTCMFNGYFQDDVRRNNGELSGRIFSENRGYFPDNIFTTCYNFYKNYGNQSIKGCLVFRGNNNPCKPIELFGQAFRAIINLPKL